MRRSSRLATRAINELSSQPAKALKITQGKSDASRGAHKVKAPADDETATYKTFSKKNAKSSPRDVGCKPKNAKRVRESSSSEDEDNRDVNRTENPLSKTKSKRARNDDDFSVVKSEINKISTRRQEKFVGAHVSIAGGLHNAVTEALAIGAKAFGLFLRSQRQWISKPLEDKNAELFREACANGGFSPNMILPHGIYLMNSGSPDDETLSKSRSTLVDELERCEKLGLCLYNFHPGSTCGKITVDGCLDRIAESINMAHKQTKYVVTVLENMSCQGNTVGGKFEELRGIIDRVHDKSRMGVCLDTCHAYAAGYDLVTESGYSHMMEEFETVVGLKYLRAVHLNDSKGDLGCHLDRHENIGKGKIGYKAFGRLMRDSRFNGIPMILETPCVSNDTYKKEIQLLYSAMR